MTNLAEMPWAIEGKHILLLGYGNPGRRDDGLGPALAAEIEQLAFPSISVEVNYQLNIEDAADAAEHDMVLFLDASAIGNYAFTLQPLHPAEDIPFTSHIVKPEVVLAICKRIYQREPQAYHLLIRGYEFGIGEGLTGQAQINLECALDYLLTARKLEAVPNYLSPQRPVESLRVERHKGEHYVERRVG